MKKPSSAHCTLGLSPTITTLYHAKNSGKGCVIINSGDREFAMQAI